MCCDPGIEPLCGNVLECLPPRIFEEFRQLLALLQDVASRSFSRLLVCDEVFKMATQRLLGSFTIQAGGRIACQLVLTLSNRLCKPLLGNLLAMVLVAPYVNSYRRLSRHTAAPINIEWGHDNRTVGIRSPISSPACFASAVSWATPMESTTASAGTSNS